MALIGHSDPLEANHNEQTHFYFGGASEDMGGIASKKSDWLLGFREKVCSKPLHL